MADLIDLTPDEEAARALVDAIQAACAAPPAGECAECGEPTDDYLFEMNADGAVRVCLACQEAHAARSRLRDAWDWEGER